MYHHLEVELLILSEMETDIPPKKSSYVGFPYEQLPSSEHNGGIQDVEDYWHLRGLTSILLSNPPTNGIGFGDTPNISMHNMDDCVGGHVEFVITENRWLSRGSPIIQLPISYDDEIETEMEDEPHTMSDYLDEEIGDQICQDYDTDEMTSDEPPTKKIKSSYLESNIQVNVNTAQACPKCHGPTVMFANNRNTDSCFKFEQYRCSNCGLMFMASTFW